MIILHNTSIKALFLNMILKYTRRADNTILLDDSTVTQNYIFVSPLLQQEARATTDSFLTMHTCVYLLCSHLLSSSFQILRLWSIQYRRSTSYSTNNCRFWNHYLLKTVFSYSGLHGNLASNILNNKFRPRKPSA